jgi:hypothetical protein
MLKLFNFLVSPMTVNMIGIHIHGAFIFVAPVTIGLIELSIGSLVWVWLDATRRGKSGWITLLFILLTGWPASFLWWFWLRPKETVRTDHPYEPNFRSGDRISA